MKDKKRQFVRCAFYDQTTMQKHFEKMASEGWLIEKISAYFWTYRRIEPTDLHITVTYFPTASEFDPGPSDHQQMMEEFAAKDGWKLLTRWSQIQVFCNTEANPTPIETDPVTQVENIYRAMKKNLIPSHLMILALVIYQLTFNGYRAFTETVDFLSTPYLLASLPVWLLLLLAEINELFTCFHWHRKARPAAENGIFIPVKTNRFITFTLLLSCVFVLFSTIQQPPSLQVFSLVWMAVIIGIILISRMIKHWLKSAGASKGTNYTVTILIVVLLTFVFLSTMTVYIIRNGLNDGRTPVDSYEQNGWTFNIYDEPMPLYVELPFLYDTIKWAMLRERQDEAHGDYIFIDHYEPIDPALWDATDAYQLHWSDSVLNTYLVCWENRILEIQFYWEPTPEQIMVVVEKLKK